MTDALKLKRKAIEQKYKDDIEDLYQEKKTKQNKDKNIKSKVNTTDPSLNTNDNKKDQ